MTTESSVLRWQHQFAHDRLIEVIRDCSPPLLAKTPEGTTTNPIAGIYAHAVILEDQLVQGMIQAKPPLFQTGSWSATTGIPSASPSFDPEWARTIDLDLQAAMGYAVAVRQSTLDFLDRASRQDFASEHELPGGVGATPTVNVLAGVMYHTTLHTGEIATLEGVEGMVGFPFL